MVISAKNLTKLYTHKPLKRFFGGLFSIQNNKYALNDISFEILKGECVGIIGKNGSGKSTLLKILSGVTSATSGSFMVNGRISALLELGTGFNPEYTGISNIYLNGIINGLSKNETKALVPEICNFAELGDYINKPIKTYSDGMFLRLAFACAIAIKPDILIIDEALAVGDFRFRQKCFKKIDELKNIGTTILMVSHDIDIIRRFCTRCLWLDSGKLLADNDVRTVSEAYMEAMTGCADFGTPNSINDRFGSSIGSIKSVNIPKLMHMGEKATVCCELDIPTGIDLKTTALSLSIKNIYGLDLTVISTADYNIRFKRYGANIIKFEFLCKLCPGVYSASISLEDRGTTPIKYYDYLNNAEVFDVGADREYFGTFHTDAGITIL